MALDINAMKQDHERVDNESGGGSEANFFNIKNGETLFYILPPCRDDDTTFYKEVFVHYGVGPNNNMTLSIDRAVNKVLNEAHTLEALQRRADQADAEYPFTVPEQGTIDPVQVEVDRLMKVGAKKKAEDMCRQRKFIWGVVPWEHRPEGAKEFTPLPHDPAVLQQGKSVWEGVLKVFFDLGDITNPDEAVLVRITKKGQGKQGTKYEVDAWSKTVRQPIKIDKGLRRAILKEQALGGKACLYTAIAGMARDEQHLLRVLSGESGEARTEDGGDDKVRPPDCFGMDYDPKDNNECGNCPFRGPCSTKSGKKLAPAHALKPGDEGYQAGTSSRSALTDDDEPDTGREDEEDDVDEDDDEPAAPVKSQYSFDAMDLNDPDDLQTILDVYGAGKTDIMDVKLAIRHHGGKSKKTDESNPPLLQAIINELRSKADEDDEPPARPPARGRQATKKDDDDDVAALERELAGLGES